MASILNQKSEIVLNFLKESEVSKLPVIISRFVITTTFIDSGTMPYTMQNVSCNNCPADNNPCLIFHQCVHCFLYRLNVYITTQQDFHSQIFLPCETSGIFRFICRKFHEAFHGWFILFRPCDQTLRNTFVYVNLCRKIFSTNTIETSFPTTHAYKCNRRRINVLFSFFSFCYHLMLWLRANVHIAVLLSVKPTLHFSPNNVVCVHRNFLSRGKIGFSSLWSLYLWKA